MANLTRTWTWEKWVPPLGDNPGEKPFYLEIASGLTKEDLEAFKVAFPEAMKAPQTSADPAGMWQAWSEQLAAVFGKHVRLGAEPLRLVDGAGAVVFEAKSLADFFLLCLRGPVPIIWEASRALAAFNSVSGQLELFFARHSGGTGTTPAPSVVKDEGQTGGP